MGGCESIDIKPEDIDGSVTLKTGSCRKRVNYAGVIETQTYRLKLKLGWCICGKTRTCDKKPAINLARLVKARWLGCLPLSKDKKWVRWKRLPLNDKIFFKLQIITRILKRSTLLLLLIFPFVILLPVDTRENSESPSTNYVGLCLKPSPLVLSAPVFQLKGVDDRSYSLASFKSAKLLVIIFTCWWVSQPLKWDQRSSELTNDYKTKGCWVVLLCPTVPNFCSVIRLGYTGTERFSWGKWKDLRVENTVFHISMTAAWKCVKAYRRLVATPRFRFDKGKTSHTRGMDGRVEIAQNINARLHQCDRELLQPISR